jgi:uncharacterized cupredoxin-like copper-binding protein
MRYRDRAAAHAAILGVVLLLAAIGAVGCSKTTTAQGGTVNVTLYDNRVESSRTSFEADTRYHFVVVNKGATNHELMLMPQGMNQMSMDEMDRIALARTGDMAAGATKAFDYSFVASETREHLEFGCYYPGHYESGMHLSFKVGT